MVIKGGARSGARDLAAHLLRSDSNERIDVIELRGVAASDLGGALQEMEAHGSATRCRRPLYHASISAAPGELLTHAQAMRAIDRLERELGFAGQPRAAVQHVKDGRTHLHVVWDRIDLVRGKAIHDGHNYRRHETVARELEREFGHLRVQGAHVERNGIARPQRTPSHAEMQQAERSGITPKKAKARITGLWRSTGSGQSFAAAVKAEGWTLARGDRRDFVLLDPMGEVHSLSRRIEGVKAKDIREHMADLDPASLPTVEEARAQIRRPENLPVLEMGDELREQARAVTERQRERCSYTFPEGQRMRPAAIRVPRRSGQAGVG